MGMDKDAEVSNSGGSCSMVGEASNFAKPTERQEGARYAENLTAPYQDEVKAGRAYHGWDRNKMPKRPEIVDREDDMLGLIMIG